MALPESSTYCSYYILMDEYYPAGIECEISNITISGRANSYMFTFDGSINRNFQLNHVSGVIFEPSPREAAIKQGAESTFYVEENTEVNAVKLFNPFFELNPKQ